MFCKHCGAQNADDAKVCTKCGQPLEGAVPVQAGTTVIVQQAAAPVKEKRNVGVLVCAIIGAIFGILAGILWMACASVFADADAALGAEGELLQIEPIIMAVCSLLGAVLTLVGGVYAFRYQKRVAAIVLSWLGAVLQVTCFIVSVVWLSGSFTAAIVVGIWTILSIILSLVAACLSFKKKPE